MSIIGQETDTLDARVASIVARKIRGRLAESERTQQDAADVLGFSVAAFNRRMKGHVDFTTPELFRLAVWLDVPLTDLLPRMDSNHQPAGWPVAA